MPLLPKFHSILQNIDQENVLNFFNIDDPTIYVFGNEISTPLSLQTLKLVLSSIFHRCTNKLGIKDIENLMIVITFIRFIITTNRYNIETSFYISLISFVASSIWYFHLKDVCGYYSGMLHLNPLTKGLATLTENNYYKDKYQEHIFQHANPEYFRIIHEKSTNFIKSACIYAINKDGYRIDPVSMIVTLVISKVPNALRIQIQNLYYLFYNQTIPAIWNLCTEQFKMLGPMLLYLFIVRVNKKYCPYLIRWHWTFIYIFQILESEIIQLLFRLVIYQRYLVLSLNERFMSYFVDKIITIIVGTHYTFTWFALLHSICGQYFYIPFLVDNIELHVGKRPQNSIYSGGYTSWQDGKKRQIEFMVKSNRRIILPKFWWGWFGKTSYDSHEILYRQKQKRLLRIKRNKKIARLFKYFRSYIFKY